MATLTGFVMHRSRLFAFSSAGAFEAHVGCSSSLSGRSVSTSVMLLAFIRLRLLYQYCRRDGFQRSHPLARNSLSLRY